MRDHLLLGLLLTTILAATAASGQPQPPEDPCALGRRIALSPPCLAGSACEAVDLWREAFGKPDIHPVAEQLPPGLAKRLPDSEIDLRSFASFEAAFERLAEVSGVEVVLHPDVKGEKINGHLAPMPVKEAWRVLLGVGGFLANFDGERVLVEKSPFDRPRGRSRSRFNCPAR